MGWPSVGALEPERTQLFLKLKVFVLERKQFSRQEMCTKRKTTEWQRNKTRATWGRNARTGAEGLRARVRSHRSLRPWTDSGGAVPLEDVNY